jgi:hypothetical protein
MVQWPGRSAEEPGSAKVHARLVGAVAQLGERLVRNEEVSGSIPLSSTKRINDLRRSREVKLASIGINKGFL